MNTSNVAITVNGQTIVRPMSHLPGLKKAARLAADMGKRVALKSSTLPLTDLTAGLQSSGSCEDCELCGGFGNKHYWIATEFGSSQWACPHCVAIQAIRKLAKLA